MEKNNVLFVVKSVNVCEDSRIMPDDKGLGVFPTREEALKCFNDNVADLKELYSEAGYEMETVDEDEDEFCARYYDRCGNINSDFVSVYECELGKWN